ncbi:TetR/AcrR family transcriptional regulator [Limibaculum sp. FT325]|uniref:TetR/AcrR family transcriptional regulator n=1 Tax=Thermohalobaculum sediminis TaxID=2939436 RepID=UPI0020BF4CC0|nr:TetR/AcrR family transcriptional regulator [Limibaculum sediminis]MCL5776735.1 TetR/AcrR family transcriptional regulator [Limibaculum sediminis]
MAQTPMPWEKKYDESEVLDRAVAAFWDHGYEATSISTLVKATGLNRGSLYAAFGDKRGLFLRALDHYDQTRRQVFLHALTAGEPPRAAIRALFRRVAEGSLGGHDRRGCLLVNTALELAPYDPEIERIVTERLGELEAFFRDRIIAAQRDDTVAPGTDAEDAGRLLLSLFIGLRVITRSYPRPKVVGSILGQVDAILG